MERPLDDAVWSRFSVLQEKRPAGFRIAALVRPPDAAFGEDEGRWLERAQQAAANGPFGQHTHWTAPDHARPTSDGTGARVLADGRWMAQAGLAPAFFCGGGWYTDAEVADACAELGYVDCTPSATRPPYLADGARGRHSRHRRSCSLPSGRTLRAIPTTHSLGDLARALFRRDLPDLVHVYFHDTDLLSRRRRALLTTLLPLLARRATVSDLERIADGMDDATPRVAWDDVARN